MAKYGPPRYPHSATHPRRRPVGFLLERTKVRGGNDSVAAPLRKPATSARENVTGRDAYSVARAIRQQLSAREKLSGLVEREILQYIWENTYAKPRAKGEDPPEWS